MILVLQIAAGVFLANLAAAMLSVLIKRHSEKKYHANAEETLEMLKSLSKLNPKKSDKEPGGGSYL
jgi:hypothetical protein